MERFARKTLKSFDRQGAFALVTVLLVLAALIALATPFLMSMRNESRIVGNRVDSTRANLSARAAREHARRILQDSHSSRDQTPLFDSEDELVVATTGPDSSKTAFPKDFFNAANDRGEIWSVTAEDEQSKVNLNSASPFTFARFFGFTSLSKPVAAEDVEIPVGSTAGFPNDGVLWLHGELIQYRAKTATSFQGCTRGFLSETKRFLEPSNHPKARYVIDDRVYALARYRIFQNLEYRPYETVRSLPMAAKASVSGALPGDLIEAQLPYFSVFSEREGAANWGAASRISNLINGGETRDIAVANSRYYNEGTTVRILGKDGKYEYAIVLETAPGGGRIKLDAPLLNSYQPFDAQIQPLLPHPININTVKPKLLEMLLTGLKLPMAEETLSSKQAQSFAKRIVDARPLTGFEDFLKRVLKPSMESTELSPILATAVYLNALHSNDSILNFSSVPFSFATEDVYLITASASVNTNSGAERARSSVHEILSIAPQEPLLFPMLRQDFFEEQLRLSREARYWLSGPENVGMYDGANNPPSRHIASLLGMIEGKPIYPSGDPELSYVAPAPYRKENGTQGNFEHFDRERNAEGRLLSEGFWTGNPATAPSILVTNSANGNGLLFPGSIEAWFKPKSWSGTFFDLGSGNSKHNRVQLFIDKADLVFRVFDEAGDDDKTTEVEAGEIRYPTAGIPTDCWSHLSISWHGNRPSDMSLMVDGVKRGTPQAFTKLSASLQPFSPSATTIPTAAIPVESTDGFPSSGVIRIGGTELVEYTSKTTNAFNAKWNTTSSGSGKDAWVGGRAARVDMLPSPSGNLSVPRPYPPSAFNLGHIKGEGVELFGYSALLRSNIPTGGASLNNNLGKFCVARFMGVKPPADGDTINHNFNEIGHGLEKENGAPRAWKLAPVEGAQGNLNFMEAFSKSGGYAIIYQNVYIAGDPNATTPPPASTPFFGVELVRYSGWTGTELNIIERGLHTNKLYAGSMDKFSGTQRAFVSKYSGPNQDYYNNNACYWAFVIPISIDASGFSEEEYKTNPNNPDLSNFIQIYDPTDESTTEWVCYDEVLNGHLIRSNPIAVQAAINAVGISPFDLNNNNNGAGCQVNMTTPTTAPAQPMTIGLQEFGTDANSLVFRVWASLKHRGVMGTFSHAHKAGCDIIPVFQTYRPGTAAEPRPGRNDRVGVFDPKFPFNPNTDWKTVNWVYYPTISDADEIPPKNIDVNRIYVAFKEQVSIFKEQNYPNTGTLSQDPRDYARIVKFPSGELGSDISSLSVGGSTGGGGAAVDGELDEIEFINNTAPGVILQPQTLCRYLLLNDVNDSANTLILQPTILMASHSRFGDPNYTGINALPKDGGFLKIDDEILAYIEYDAISGTLTLAPNGRGMLNTEASGHGKDSPVIFLSNIRASHLTSDVSVASGSLPIKDSSKYPNEGTVLIDRELIHFTHKFGDSLSMPMRKVTEITSKNEEQEEGVFRGRYGTVANSHTSGTMAVVFPFRYWDRYREQTDVAELSYFGTHLKASGGYFQTLFWEEDPTIRDPFVECVALARVDDWADWNANPANAAGIYLFEDPIKKGVLNHIDRAGNRLEVRFFTHYKPGAFDPENFVAHSWKRAPKIKKVAVEYQAPNQVLWRSEGRW